MCATVFYTKLINGRLYPKAARAGPFAYANEVSGVQGKVVSKYVGIAKVPDNTNVVESADVVENKAGTNVVENVGEADANDTREPE